jgi:hypothetical protein
MFWVALKSFEVMEGPKGSYKTKRKRAESENVDNVMVYVVLDRQRYFGS